MSDPTTRIAKALKFYPNGIALVAPNLAIRDVQPGLRDAHVQIPHRPMVIVEMNVPGLFSASMTTGIEAQIRFDPDHDGGRLIEKDLMDEFDACKWKVV
jgi:hypothetical protein